MVLNADSYSYVENILEYYINSNGTNKKICRNGKYGESTVETCGDTDNLQFDNNWSHQTENDFEHLNDLLLEYSKICEKYEKYITYEIEMKIIQKHKKVSLNNNNIKESIVLYSVNIGIKNKQNKKYYEKGFGGSNKFDVIEDLNDEISAIISSLINSDYVKSLPAGFYDVILDSEATGLFVHEVVGHCFEADNSIITKEIIDTKKYTFNSKMTIVDNPLLKNGYGSYKYDDECTTARQTFLIRNGKINSLLHSCETATMNNTKSTGNARTISSEHLPIVRMSNTYMLPNPSVAKEELFKNTKYGVYFKGCFDSVGGLNFVLNFRETYLIKDGQVCERISDMVMIGELFKTLSRIVMIANDLKIDGGGRGGCGKNGQWPLAVSAGGPHIKLKSVLLIPALSAKNQLLY